MNLMEKLTGLFQRPEVPDEMRDVFARAKDPRDLLKGLETLRGRNEIELRDAENDLATVEQALAGETDRIVKGELTPAVKTSVLRRIERLEKQLANLQARATIFNENVNLHLNLIARIQEIQAMELRGVDEDRIDEILVEADAQLSDYRRTFLAQGEGERPAAKAEQTAEQQRLEALEKRLKGGAPAPKSRDRRSLENEP